MLYAAVSYTANGASKPVFGTVRIEADTDVSVAERLVSISDFQITESNFPALPKDQVRDLVAEISTSVPRDERVIALDRLLAALDKSQIIPKNVEGVKADPPAVFFSKTPAVLVNLDGDPIWSPIAGNDLEYAVNTNWDLFRHGPTKTFILRASDTWMKAPAIDGPWTYAGRLPDSFFKLPNDANFADAKGALPGKRIAASQAPKVFVSTTPAEIILLRGEPTYLLVDGARQLLWVSNTDADVFRMGRTGPVYFLVAGRWFSAPDYGGPWTFATPTCRPTSRPSLASTRARVSWRPCPARPRPRKRSCSRRFRRRRASARISRRQTSSTRASRSSRPSPPPPSRGPSTPTRTSSRSATSTTCVSRACGSCRGARPVRGRSPASVPAAIYQIPASSPSYAVTYVTVQESNSDAVVFATALAFTGVMVAWGCAVWGTGYYYPPYVWHGAYPVYYPHYPTYGYGAAYNPWTGSYTRGAAAYGPYGGAGAAARYNPTTGTYSRGAVAYGPSGAQGAAQAYNPRTGAYGQTRQGSNVYGNWGSSSVQRGDQWANTAHATNNLTGTTTRAAQTSQGNAVSRSGPAGNSAAARGTGGDVYAGHDGNVYKKSGDSWQKYDNGGWNSVQQPTPAQRQQAQTQATQVRSEAQGRAAAAGIDSGTMGQLNRDSLTRAEGTDRTNRFSGWRSRGGSEAPRSFGGLRGLTAAAGAGGEGRKAF